jgi:two-component system response regulator HydG
MNPRLFVQTGLRDEETIELRLEDAATFTIGRAVECDLPLISAAVSRRHCFITRGENDEFRIEDLDSHNGTRVNNSPVKSKLLVHGDRINLGKASLIFLTEDDDAPALQAEFEDKTQWLNSTVRLISYHDTDVLSPDLNALVKLGKAIGELKNTESLERRFLEIILEFIPARRGAIVLTDADLTEPQVTCVLGADASDIAEPMQISRTVCRRVLSEQAALLSNNLADSNLNLAESLISSSASSVLCVPLKIDRQFGLIYLDSTDADFEFTENHLAQMIALSFLIGAALTGAESIESLRQENKVLKQDLKLETKIIGESPPIREIFRLISKIAPTNSTVLISGESGTGKELAAKAIYQNSSRRAKPFIAVNCAVMSENLVEAELFGYEKGAFTGATQMKRGKLEQFDGGTIFFDEIAELSPNVQAKLLRVLQERQFERLGGTKTIKVDVRLIAATNRSLVEEVKKGTFREDLFFRLNVLQIHMPPLRDRKSDIPLLAQHFVKKHVEKCGRKVGGLSDDARQMLVDSQWQGNVRELENIIERAIVLGAGETITPEDLPKDLRKDTETAEKPAPEIAAAREIQDYYEQIKLFKQQIIRDALLKSNNNYSEAARGLGIHPNNLHRIMRGLEIK